MLERNIIILCVMINVINSDIKSSLKNIIPVASEPVLCLEAQLRLIEHLEYVIGANNLTQSKRKLKFLQNELARNKVEYMKARGSKHYFENAVNRVIFIKRLTTDLDVIINQGVGWKKNVSIRYPLYKDLELSVGALAELQRFYNLNVTKLADGMPDTNVSSPLTASDCYAIGKVMFKSNHHKEGVPWLLEAFRLYKTEKPYDVKIVNVVSAICKGYDVLADDEKYLQWAKKLIAIKPQYKKDVQHKINIPNNMLQNLLDNREKQIQEQKNERMYSINPANILESDTKVVESKIFGMLCRGEIGVNPEVSRKLKCWYSAGHHPFSILARFRTEQLFVEPDLLLVHNMLSDDEINAITSFASSQYVIKSEILYEKHTVFPFLKYAELDRMKGTTKEKMSRRVSHLTGLKVNVSPWIISKYAVGGKYHIHLDSKSFNPYDSSAIEYYNLTCPLKRDEDNRINLIFEGLKKICRIGSVVIYLSNLEQGGATVFPRLGVVVNPVKGSALFWANLFPSGDSDNALYHGSCPVLQGTKTVAVKFIPYANQFLTCPLTAAKRKIEAIPLPITL